MRVADGCILRIEKASIHDGEGLRNVVFFKGCPLKCAWCSTPESQRFEMEIGFDASKCARCGACAATCSSGALRLDDGKLTLKREMCVACFKCVLVCPNEALKKYGGVFTVQDITREVSKDEIFYFHSGGGVTLSGGEPCAQPHYVSELLRELKFRGIHTAIETSLYAPWEDVEKLLPHLDCVFADMKHMDTVLHEKWTGAGNEIILENIARIISSEFQVSMTLRVPIIPGVNDDDGNLSALAGFANGLANKLQAIELLPYHRLGCTTYRLLQKQYPLESVTVQPWEKLEERARFLSSHDTGVPILAGGRSF